MRHLKTPLTMLALLALLIGGSALGWKLLTTDVPTLGSVATAEPTCRNQTIDSGAKIGRGQVTVNVYNAGTTSGLADSTLNTLIDKGFIAGTVGNAPTKLKTKRVIVVSPDPESAAVRLVAAQFKGTTKVQKVTTELAEGIDVIVGDNFLGFKKKAKLEIKVAKNTIVCVPITPTITQ